MFNTFIGVIPDDNINPTERRRTIVSKACVECRRRKTKCIGTHPCSGCIACNVECVFPEFRRRGRKSQKQTAKPTEKKDCENIVKLLFPNSSIQSLRGLSREALLERAKLEGELSPPTSNGNSSVASPAHAVTPMSFPGSDSQPRLLDIQRQGSTIFQWDETSQWSGQEGEEDTSAFALSPDGNTTFQGIGSIPQYQFSERFYVPELFSGDWQYSNNGQSIHLGASYIEDQPFLPPYNTVYPS